MILVSDTADQIIKSKIDYLERNNLITGTKQPQILLNDTVFNIKQNFVTKQSSGDTKTSSFIISISHRRHLLNIDKKHHYDKVLISKIIHILYLL
jgi:hypothetical protein